MKGVGRNPKGDGKKKGGLKVHLLTDVLRIEFKNYSNLMVKHY
jgi:hypothetical protein